MLTVRMGRPPTVDGRAGGPFPDRS
jgi:hypothetical protein